MDKNILRLFAFGFILLWGLIGCQGNSATPTTTPDGMVDTAAELTAALQEMDFVVQAGGPFQDFLLEGGGQLLLVNGQQLQVWEFPTVEAADEARTFLSGADSPLATIRFTAPPRFFQKGAMVVLFVDTNRSILNALTAILGDPFL